MGRRSEPIRFALRFPIEELDSIAGRYSYEDDTVIREIGRAIRHRGWADVPEMMTLGRWKSPRLMSRLASNTIEHIREATSIALSARTENVRIGVLRTLSGVDWPMASVFLHLAHADPYPILDQRALWSLGLDAVPSTYTQNIWDSYVRCCRELAQTVNVEMRTLDRALWQFSKEQQPGTLR